MANCANTEINKVPLNDGDGLYINSNDIPQDHLTLGVEVANTIVKVDVNGEPATNGKKVVAFIGMSNWNQEIKQFVKLYRDTHGGRKNTWLNAGRGGWDLRRMVVDSNEYWTWFHKKLVGRDPTRPLINPKQIQVVFFKNSIAGRDGQLPPNQHIIEYGSLLNAFLNRMKVELPNVKQVFLSSAIYSGYAGSQTPRIEPNAYYEGQAVKNVVLAHLTETKPWIAWGAYLWADGVNERSDGLVWECKDFEADGVHPTLSAELKVANLLMKFMETSPVTKWFYT